MFSTFFSHKSPSTIPGLLSPTSISSYISHIFKMIFSHIPSIVSTISQSIYMITAIEAPSMKKNSVLSFLCCVEGTLYQQGRQFSIGARDTSNVPFAASHLLNKTPNIKGGLYPFVGCTFSQLGFAMCNAQSHRC